MIKTWELDKDVFRQKILEEFTNHGIILKELSKNEVQEEELWTCIVYKKQWLTSKMQTCGKSKDDDDDDYNDDTMMTSDWI